MAEKYKIVLVNNSEIEVEDPDIDEESRMVRVVKHKISEGEEETVFYDYYPFEQILKIIFVSSD